MRLFHFAAPMPPRNASPEAAPPSKPRFVRVRLWRVPLVVSGVIVAATLLLRAALGDMNHAQLDRTLEAQTAAVRNEVAANMNSRLLALNRLARTWEQHEGGMTRQEWSFVAALNYNDFPGFEALQRADTTLHVRWMVPAQGYEALQNFFLASEPRRREALEHANDTRATAITKPVELAVGGTGFIAYTPFFDGDRLAGYMGGVFRAGETFRTILGHDIAPGYDISIYDGDTQLYHRAPFSGAAATGYTHRTLLPLPGTAWTITVVPSIAMVVAASSPLPAIALASGLSLAALLGLALYLLQLGRVRAAEAKAANHALHAEFEVRERVESALSRERDFALQVTNAMGQGLTITNSEGRFDYVNPAFARMLGYEPAELIGASPVDLAPPTESASLARGLEQCASGAASSFESCLRRADGTEIFVYTSLTPRRDGERNAGAIAVVSNLSRRKQMENALRESEERFRRLSAATVEGVLLHVNGVITDCNRSAATMFGYSEDDPADRR